MRSINLGNDKDPQKQQMAMFRLALYAASLLTAIVIFVGLSERHRRNLGVVIALICWPSNSPSATTSCAPLRRGNRGRGRMQRPSRHPHRLRSGQRGLTTEERLDIAVADRE
jgi:hypothetical protein